MLLDFCVDRILWDHADGWAWLPDQLHEVVTIEMISTDGRIVAQTVADGFRVDLSAADKRAGWCAFTLPIPASCPDGRYRLGARVREATEILTEPFILTGPAERAESPSVENASRRLLDVEGAAWQRPA